MFKPGKNVALLLSLFFQTPCAYGIFGDFTSKFSKDIAENAQKIREMAERKKQEAEDAARLLAEKHMNEAQAEFSERIDTVQATGKELAEPLLSPENSSLDTGNSITAAIGHPVTAQIGVSSESIDNPIDTILDNNQGSDENSPLSREIQSSGEMLVSEMSDNEPNPEIHHLADSEGNTNQEAAFEKFKDKTIELLNRFLSESAPSLPDSYAIQLSSLCENINQLKHQAKQYIHSSVSPELEGASADENFMNHDNHAEYYVQDTANMGEDEDNLEIGPDETGEISSDSELNIAEAAPEVAVENSENIDPEVNQDVDPVNEAVGEDLGLRSLFGEADDAY